LNNLNPVNYNSGREIRAFLEERGLGARKKFGQNFLINPRVRSALLDAMELRGGEHVWEIGPGLGAMTAGLLERGAWVTAFEIDPAFAGILRGHFAPLSNGQAPGTFRLVEGDALKTWRKVEALPAEEMYLFGNLPYSAAAALLADFIENGRFFKRIVVTVQREVALRMAAAPGSSDYSSFSVLCSSVYKVTPLFIIKGSSFYPAPRVDSQGVRFDLLPVRGDLPRLFYPLVRGLFSSRRKTIRNTLTAFAASVIINKPVSQGASCTARDAALEALNRASISGDRRPEMLDKDEFAALAAFLEEIVR
jgi:16S rRNA (adenine1518-N6/adenine1519-N6)-dimethyltransferase